MRLGLLSTANINRQIIVGARGAGQVVGGVGGRGGLDEEIRVVVA